MPELFSFYETWLKLVLEVYILHLYAYVTCVKGTGYTFKGKQIFKIVLPLFQKGVTIKRK